MGLTAEVVLICTETEKKKEYLMRYRGCIKGIELIEQEIESLRSSQIMPSHESDGMPHGSRTVRDMSGYAAKLDELKRELDEQLSNKYDIMRKVVSAIEQLDSEAEKCLLRMRYIHGYPWLKIATEMCYSEDHVRGWLHGHALLHFKVPND